MFNVEASSNFLKRSAKVGGLAALMVLATLPLPAQAGEQEIINLTPPEGSVTPGAFGRVNVEVLSKHADYRVELLIKGELNGLVPNREYRVWACWNTEGDCSTNRDPEIRTNLEGSVSFEGLRFDIFNRPHHPIASLQVREETSGAIPSDACYVGTTPCLRASFFVN